MLYLKSVNSCVVNLDKAFLVSCKKVSVSWLLGKTESGLICFTFSACVSVSVVVSATCCACGLSMLVVWAASPISCW